MAANSDKPIVMRVDSVAEIFNAPDANPFAAGEGNILGEAALDRLLLVLPHFWWRWRAGLDSVSRMRGWESEQR